MKKINKIFNKRKKITFLLLIVFLTNNLVACNKEKKIASTNDADITSNETNDEEQITKNEDEKQEEITKNIPAKSIQEKSEALTTNETFDDQSEQTIQDDIIRDINLIDIECIFDEESKQILSINSINNEKNRWQHCQDLIKKIEDYRHQKQNEQYLNVAYQTLKTKKHGYNIIINHFLLMLFLLFLLFGL